MKKLSWLILFVAVMQSAVAQEKRMKYVQEKTNAVDAKNRKQGPWIEQVESIRGEPGFSWEGVYKNDRKEGVWKKYAVSGDLLAEETYQNGALNGLCKYYFPDGKLNAAGNMMAVDIEGQKDTVVVVDPVTGAETLTEVVRKGNSVKQGEWKVYDEDGNMVRETYERGELSNTENSPRRQKAAPLPHEQQAGGRKKKGKDE